MNSDKIAQAIMTLEETVFDMGDSFVDVLEGVASLAGDETVCNRVWEMTGEELKKALVKEYLFLLENKPEEIVKLAQSWFEHHVQYEQIEHGIQFESLDSYEESKTWKALKVMEEFLSEYGGEKAAATLICVRAVLSRVERIDFSTLKAAKKIAHSYWRLLPEEYFGVQTNDVFTVGHLLTEGEKKAFPELSAYTYVCHKMVRGTDSDIAICFKRSNGRMCVDFILCKKRYEDTVTKQYMDKIDSLCLGLDDGLDVVSQMVANKCIELAKAWQRRDSCRLRRK